MKRSSSLCGVIGLVLQSHVALSAEDHSAHQQPKPSVVPAPTAPAANGEDHSAHQQHSIPAANEEPTESERRHIPPPPPQRAMRDMSAKEMIELMQMDDSARHGMVLLDQFEWSRNDGNDVLSWDGHAWYGGDYHKLWLKFEGESVDSEQEGRTELLWDRNFSRWWSLQTGVRHDFGEGPSRTWAAFGVQGLAPYWFEIDAAVYVGEQGRTAARFAAEYELLLTQRLILQPEFEVNLYGKDDSRNALGSGLADTQLGLRLRYEIRREFAPYVGVAWSNRYGRTADLARAAGRDSDELQWVMGIRAWF